MKNPAAGWERGEAGDFDWVRSGRRHPHRSAKRNKNYRKKKEAERQHAQIGRRFRGAQDRSSGGAVGQGKTFQLGALMPSWMLRRNPNELLGGIKMRLGAKSANFTRSLRAKCRSAQLFTGRARGRPGRGPRSAIETGEARCIAAARRLLRGAHRHDLRATRA